jgi:hypothetical protein
MIILHQLSHLIFLPRLFPRIPSPGINLLPTSLFSTIFISENLVKTAYECIIPNESKPAFNATTFHTYEYAVRVEIMSFLANTECSIISPDLNMRLKEMKQVYTSLFPLLL